MLAITTTQYYTATSIDGLIADSENSLSWLFQFSEPSGMEDEYPQFIAEVWRDGDGLHDVRVDRQHTGFLSEPSNWRGVPELWNESSGRRCRPACNTTVNDSSSEVVTLCGGRSASCERVVRQKYIM